MRVSILIVLATILSLSACVSAYSMALWEDNDCAGTAYTFVAQTPYNSSCTDPTSTGGVTLNYYQMVTCTGSAGQWTGWEVKLYNHPSVPKPGIVCEGGSYTATSTTGASNDCQRLYQAGGFSGSVKVNCDATEPVVSSTGSSTTKSSTGAALPATSTGSNNPNLSSTGTDDQGNDATNLSHTSMIVLAVLALVTAAGAKAM